MGERGWRGGEYERRSADEVRGVNCDELGEVERRRERREVEFNL